MISMKCARCGAEGGSFIKIKETEDEWICRPCIVQWRAENRIASPVVRGNFSDFTPWFNWQKGELVHSRAQEREMEKAGPCGTLNDKGFAKDYLGLSDTDVQHAQETLKARKDGSLLQDRALGEKMAGITERNKAKGKRTFNDHKVRSLDPISGREV